MLAHKLLLSLGFCILFTSNASAESLGYFADPIATSATVDQCQNAVTKNSKKINSFCRNNGYESGKISRAGEALDRKHSQVENRWLKKKERINFSYANKRDSLALRIAELNAIRADILANCSGGERCTRKANAAANRIGKLDSQVELNAEKWTNALLKNDSLRSQQLAKAEETYSERLARSESKITSNNTEIDVLNSEIVACNGTVVSCSGI